MVNRRDQQRSVDAMKRIVDRNVSVQIRYGRIVAVFQDSTISVEIPGSAKFTTAQVPRGVTPIIGTNAVICQVPGMTKYVVLGTFSSEQTGVIQSQLEDKIAPPINVSTFAWSGGLIGCMWQTVPGIPLVFDVSWQKEGSDAPVTERVTSCLFIKNVDEAVDYRFRVRSVSQGGRVSAWTDWQTVTPVTGVVDLDPFHILSADASGVTQEYDASDIFDFSDEKLAIKENYLLNKHLNIDAQINIEKLADNFPGAIFSWNDSGKPAPIQAGPPGHALISKGPGLAPEYSYIIGTIPTGTPGELITFEEGAAVILPAGNEGEYLRILSGILAWSDIVNANQIHGREIFDSSPSNRQVIQWIEANSRWEYVDILIKVSSDDTTSSYLLDKINVAAPLTKAEGTPGGNETVNLGVNQAQIDHTQISNRGTNTHSQIDSHISNTSNPHSVTATQVGKDTAQWNADELQGRSIDTAAPSNGQGLVWDASVSKWKPGNPVADFVVEEVDGTPTVASVNKLIVPNGTLVDNENGSVTLDLSSTTDDKTLKVSSNDDTPNFLQSKILEGTDISFEIVDEGDNEKIRIHSTATSSPQQSDYIFRWANFR